MVWLGTENRCVGVAFGPKLDAKNGGVGIAVWFVPRLGYFGASIWMGVVAEIQVPRFGAENGCT